MEYAYLLAAAAQPYGGASTKDWLHLLGTGLGAASKLALRPFATDLAARSGHGICPLFSGQPSAASGAEALRHAHESAFGTGLSPQELLAAGLHGTDKLPSRLAERLSRNNQQTWRVALLTWQRTHVPLLSSADAGTWADKQTPSDCGIPIHAPTGATRTTLHASFDAVVCATAAQLVAATKAALHIQRLPGDNLFTQASRCVETTFLMRYFRRVIWRGFETMRMHGKQVGRRGAEYVSAEGFAQWHKRQQAHHEWMQHTMVKDNHGKCPPRPLSEVAPSNRARRARLLAVMAGIETLAMETGLSAAMITITLPSVWHPNPAHGAGSWGGSEFTPDLGAQTLVDDWAALLRDLDNAGVKVAGIRVVEPHADG